jgi:hypothetical protein
MENKNFGFDLNLIADAFDIQRVNTCEHLDNWMAANFNLTESENEIIDQLHADMSDFGDYLNEEELKIQFVGSAFLVARVNVAHKIRVFYERSMSAIVNNYELSVISDCLIASPKRFNAPQKPYFFLQEFKKGKGEKVDPEAQMIVAMLIAQEKNQDNYPIYGGYLVGRNWIFTTLLGNNYCVSRQFDATKRVDICQIIFNLRQLKGIILKRED